MGQYFDFNVEKRCFGVERSLTESVLLRVI